MRGAADKTGLISILVELQAQAAAAAELLPPSELEEKDQVSNVVAQIDSHHNLLLSAAVQRTRVHRGARRLSEKDCLTLFMPLYGASASLQLHCLIISESI